MYKNIVKDYHWKINIELAQTYDRLKDENKMNEYLQNAIRESPDTVKWKIWLVASRIMQNSGHSEKAKLCIERACMEVPSKQVSTALLEYSKYYEITEDKEKAI
jgi:lipopolysaccharide biosynthesis regulator YciM